MLAVSRSISTTEEEKDNKEKSLESSDDSIENLNMGNITNRNSVLLDNSINVNNISTEINNNNNNSETSSNNNNTTITITNNNNNQLKTQTNYPTFNRKIIFKRSSTSSNNNSTVVAEIPKPIKRTSLFNRSNTKRPKIVKEIPQNLPPHNVVDISESSDSD